jgi:hypothetical protein
MLMSTQRVNALSFAVRVCAVFAIGTVISCATARAVSITLREGLDSYAGTSNVVLRSGTPTTPNGATPGSLIVGTNFVTPGPGTQDHSLLGFSLSPIITAAGGNPVTINSVELILSLGTGGTVQPAGHWRVETGGGGVTQGPVSIDLHAYGFAFVDSAATWNAPATGDATAGGTAGTLLGSATGLMSDPLLTVQQQTFTSAALTQWVQDAADNIDPTARFLINQLSPNLSVQNRVFLRTKTQATGTTTRPTLVIDYTVVPEPNAFIILGIGLIAIVASRCKKLGWQTKVGYKAALR